MTVKIDEKDKNGNKRKYEASFASENKSVNKETSPKLKRKKVCSIGTETEIKSSCAPSSLCVSGSPLSTSATVCYEGEGILVVQLEWRGKTFFGTLLSQDKCDRNFKISETFPILNKTSMDVVKEESDFKDDLIKEDNLNNKKDKTLKEENEKLTTTKSENKRELNKENSTDCFDFDNEESPDSVADYKSTKKPKKQFTKGFKCDLCEKKYTWYTGLSNHKRFVHNNKTKET